MKKAPSSRMYLIHLAPAGDAVANLSYATSNMKEET